VRGEGFSGIPMVPRCAVRALTDKQPPSRRSGSPPLYCNIPSRSAHLFRQPLLAREQAVGSAVETAAGFAKSVRLMSNWARYCMSRPGERDTNEGLKVRICATRAGCVYDVRGFKSGLATISNFSFGRATGSNKALNPQGDDRKRKRVEAEMVRKRQVRSSEMAPNDYTPPSVDKAASEKS